MRVPAGYTRADDETFDGSPSEDGLEIKDTYYGACRERVPASGRGGARALGGGSRPRGPRGHARVRCGRAHGGWCIAARAYHARDGEHRGHAGSHAGLDLHSVRACVSLSLALSLARCLPLCVSLSPPFSEPASRPAAPPPFRRRLDHRHRHLRRRRPRVRVSGAQVLNSAYSSDPHAPGPTTCACILATVSET